MNAQPDVASIVAGAKNPEITALEARLADVRKLELEAGREWAKWSEAADPALSSATKPKTADTIAAAKIELEKANRGREDLAREASELCAKIEQRRPASLAAITAALEPTRDRAAEDIRAAVAALYAAIALYNSTSAALRASGDESLATRDIPRRFPVVDYFVAKVTPR